MVIAASRREVASLVTTLLAAAVVGLAVAVEPLALLVAPALVAAWACLARPYLVAATAMVACSVYSGVYLTYRLDAGGVPLSALDTVPLCLFLSALVASARHRAGAASLPGWTALVLFAAGLVSGVAVAYAGSALTTETLRVLRIEGLLIVALAAALVGGHSKRWRDGISRGLVLAALLAAGLQMLSTGFQLAFGYPLWSLLPFGATNVAGFANAGVASGGSNTRDNLLPLFIMLPTIALSAFRLHRRDQVILAVLLIAAAVSLSRSMWAASVIVLFTAWLARRVTGQQRSLQKFGALVAALVVVGAGASFFAGDFLGSRASSSLSRDDVSATYRETEVRETLAELGRTPGSEIIGLGAGAYIPPIGETTADPTPILENQLLARLTNFGVLSVAATALLLLAGTASAVRTLRIHGDDELSGLALALPAVLAISMISGVVFQLQVTVPFWVLAGTIIAGGPTLRSRAPATAMSVRN